MAKAKSGGGEAKIGMILTLVFFILSTLILGTLYYMSFADISAAAEAKKKAETAANEKQKTIEQERVRKVVLRIALGMSDKGDQDTLEGLIGQQPGEVSDEIDRVKGGLKNLPNNRDFDWPAIGDAPKLRPSNTLLDLVRKYNEEAETARKAQKNAEEKATDALAKAEAAATNLANANKAHEEVVKRLNDDVNKEKSTKSEAFMASNTLVKVTGEERDAKTAEINKQRKGFLDEQQKLNETIAEMQRKIDRLESRQSRTYVDVNRPKGLIERRDGATVYINLGSADLLRVGTRFSIFASDTSGELASSYRGQVAIDLFSREVRVQPLDAETERTLSRTGRLDVPDELRGAIEVTGLLGPHQAAARIIYERDAIRSPVRVSDKLFNPAWNAGGVRERVVVAGLIDLDGDTTDDTQQFINELRRRGVQVDGYLDTATRKLAGSSVGFDTDYLIIGEPLSVPTSSPNDPRRDQAVDFNQAIQKLQTEALAKGVEVLRAKRFMALVGYEVPTRAPGQQLNPATYFKAPAAAAEGGDAPKADAEGPAKDK